MPSRILIVEDDAVLADGMSSVLRKNGYSAHCLTDGVHAHDTLEAEPYDLAILDLGLPRMDGLELLRRLRARITPLRKYDLHRESSGIPDVLAVEETLDHIGLPLATVQV